MAEKGGYKHFMLKEIYEQPRAIADTLAGRILEDDGDVYLDGLDARRGRAAGDWTSSSWSPAAPPGTPGWSASS